MSKAKETDRDRIRILIGGFANAKTRVVGIERETALWLAELAAEGLDAREAREAKQPAPKPTVS